MVLIGIVLKITVSVSLEVDLIVMKYAVTRVVFVFVGFVSNLFYFFYDVMYNTMR
jgi:hypothetical protein